MFNNSLKNINEITDFFPSEQICIYHLEKLRWANNIVSPFDKKSKVYKCKKNNYRCKNTGKYFNVKTGTLFSNSKIPLQKWFIAIWLATSYNPDISIDKFSKQIGVSNKTGRTMLNRIKKCYQIN